MSGEQKTILIGGLLFVLFILGGMSLDRSADKRLYEMCAKVAESVEEYQKCVNP